ncbi:hypothetical protein ACEQPO_14525 [Bacillus sp. SL00103]
MTILECKGKDQHDLADSVKSEVNRFMEATNIPVHKKISDSYQVSPFLIEHTIYIVSECLTNIAKHAKESQSRLGGLGTTRRPNLFRS